MGLLRFKKKKIIGAALGSGGAKGMAHLGALQALNESGVCIEAYAGTSAGSIVGALCANGYTPADIRQLLAHLDYKGLALSVLTAGSLRPAFAVLEDVMGESEFSELKFPFAAVATDASTGEEIVLRSGSVTRAVLASSAMPPFFRGVEADGRKLIDGAFCNAVPGDVARSLGADFVIGIALSPVSTYCCGEWITTSGKRIAMRQTGFRGCDILLEPDLAAYAATDVFGGARMYDIGYECAMRRMPEIMRLLREKSISGGIRGSF